MTGDFSNVYADDLRAGSYARLEFPGTYFLAFRDLPQLYREHLGGKRALDFGCGAGRSSRFLQRLGFEVVGIDISEPMLARARQADPEGDYQMVPDGDLSSLPAGAFDLVQSAFTFDNVPTQEKKVALLRGLGRVLRPGGRIVSLVSTPEIYTHEWASFSTRDYPENRDAKCGDTVRIVMLDVEDRRPVEDILWTPEAYQAAYREAGLALLQRHQPLGKPDESFGWVSELTIPPWTVDVLALEPR